MRADAAAFIRENALAGAEITASAAEVGYPAENVLERSADVIFRTIEDDAFIEFDMGEAREIGAVVVRLPAERDPDLPSRNTLSTTSTVTLTGWADRADPAVFTSSFIAGHDERLGYVAHVLGAPDEPEPQSVRHLRIAFENVGQLDIDAIWAGPLWQPDFHFNRGGQFGFDEVAETARSAFSGRRFSETRSRTLRWVLSWDAWGPEQLDGWEDFAVSHGLVRPFAAFRTLTAPLERRVMIATFAQAPIQTDRDGYHWLIRADLSEDF